MNYLQTEKSVTAQKGRVATEVGRVLRAKLRSSVSPPSASASSPYASSATCSR